MFEFDNIPDEYNQLIETIYQGPLESPPWKRLLLLLGSYMDALSVSLVLKTPANGNAGLILNYRRADEHHEGGTQNTLADPADWAASAYREHFFALDPFIHLPLGKVVTLAELIPAEQLEKSEYYNQYLQPAGVFHIVGADTREPGGMIANLRVSRGLGENPFDETHKRLITMIVPHLTRSLQFHARLNLIESERDLYAIAVDKLAVGTVMLNDEGKVLNNNTMASQTLAEKDGLSVRKQQLHISNSQQDKELQQLLANFTSQAADSKPAVAEAMRISRPSGKADLGLVIRPIPTSEWSEGESFPTIAVFISDPEQQTETSQQVITRLFGFTPAEATLAMLLARGLSLAEASEQQSISQHTARAQLKSIFAKTGVTRQAELVRLVVKSVANLG